MLSVIIPALNSGKTINYTLSSLFSNDFPRDLFEVLVVDNGSTDNTVDIARKYPVRICYCERRGIGPPRNMGIKEAKGEILCFTDSDCVIEGNWLREIYNFFRNHPEADGVGGPVLSFPKNQNKIQRYTGEIFCEDILFPQKIERVEFRAFGTVPLLLLGSNSAYKKETLVSVGGFYEPEPRTRGTLGSDVEFSWKLTAKEKILFFTPNMRVLHIFPWNLRTILKQYFRWGSGITFILRKYSIQKARLRYIISYIPLAPVKNFLSLLSFTNPTKRLLRLVQSLWFSLGQVYGYKIVEYKSEYLGLKKTN